MENTPVVKEDLTTPEVVAPQTEVTPQPVVEEATTPVPGDKTDSAKLLESLQTERTKRQVAEDKVKLLEEQANNPPDPSEPEIFSDEGKTLQSEIKGVNAKVSKLENENLKKDVIIAYPILKDKMIEFKEFCDHPDNKGMNMKTSAKAFITEKGLLEKPRKGLEQPTGGDRTPQSTGMTAEEVRKLRTTDHRKYKDMLSKGLIQIKD